jgi:hypothetical protein
VLLFRGPVKPKPEELIRVSSGSQHLEHSQFVLQSSCGAQHSKPWGLKSSSLGSTCHVAILRGPMNPAE